MVITTGIFEETIQSPGEAPQTVTVHRLWFLTIADQIRYVRKMINKWRGRPQLRHLAMQIIREAGCPQKNRLCQAYAIAQAVKDRIYYINERPEIFQEPMNTWRWRYGDCDDFVSLEGSLLESVGIKVEVVGMKIDKKWRHVFPIAIIPISGKKAIRLPLDATLSQPLGPRANPITIALRLGHRVDTLNLPSEF